MLQTVANGLGELKDEMVFVGGSVAELYANNPAASDIRPTLDVDCVVELSSKTAHAKLEEKLREKNLPMIHHEVHRFVGGFIKIFW